MDVSRETTARLLGTSRRTRWFPEVEANLYTVRMLRLWIAITCRRVLQEMHPDDPRAKPFAASGRRSRKFAKRCNLPIRRKVAT